MSNDTNWVRPDHNAYDRMLEPLPELDSDELYIEKRKARERVLMASHDYVRDEVIPDCLTDKFIMLFSKHLRTGDSGIDAFNELTEQCKLYIAKQARQDIDNEVP